jgi:hypothetical protein
MLRAKRANQQPSAVLVSQLANMEVVRLRLMEEMAKAEAEIREYNQQADMDYQRLSELLASKH